MYHPPASTSLLSLSLKAYKETIRKLQAHHLEDSSSGIVQHTKQQLLTKFQDYEFSAPPDVSRALSRLQSALLDTDVREVLKRGKSRAKAKLKRAQDRYNYYVYGKRLTTYSAQSNQLHAVTETDKETRQQLDALYGRDGDLRRAVFYVLGHASKVIMNTLNTTHVEGVEHLQAALERPRGQPLITISNHVAALDDPLVVATILPEEQLAKPQNLRWTLCATDRCFKNEFMSGFFRAAKVLPVQRGAGMHQLGMQAAEDRLNHGDWVHIFPEGTRSKSGKMGPVRKGVGRLIAACEHPPLVLPFVHSGMENVLPRGKMLPAVGKEVKVVVGEPIDVRDLLAASTAHDWTDDQLYCAIANRISTRMHALKARADGVPLESYGDAMHEVSTLDLFDKQDLVVGGRLRTFREWLKFKVAHRQWLQHSGVNWMLGGRVVEGERAVVPLGGSITEHSTRDGVFGGGFVSGEGVRALQFRGAELLQRFSTIRSKAVMDLFDK